MIELDRVEKVYRTPRGEVRALAGVSLAVPAGQFVVVRGASGCGKSTLLNLIGGLARPTAGTVRVDGQDLGAMTAGRRAAFRAGTVGFVFQTFHLVPYLTVLENVTMAAASPAGAFDRAKQLLEEFGLGPRLEHHPAELSAGESQRVAIARAMLNRPPLLLADEPTGNLDRENAAAVLDLLAGFHRQGGTVLLVTHQELPGDYGDRVLLLKEGQVQADSPPISRANLANSTATR